jgi:hypothetical protein
MSENSTTTDIYRDNAESLWLSESDAVFSNGQDAHAAILYETFLKFGKRELLMLVKNLSEPVFRSKEIESLMYQALCRGVKIDVICQESPKSQDTLRKFDEWKRSKLPINYKVCAPGNSAAQVKANFAVVDGRAYRFEKDRETTKASACMNDPDSARILREAFFRYKAIA